MYDTIKRLYGTGKLTDKGLENAVNRGWITTEEAGEISATKEKEGSR